MAFESILYERAGAQAQPQSETAFVRDLHIDQIVESLIAGKEEYDLEPLFYAAVTSVAAVAYRQEIMRELEDENVLACVRAFAQRFRRMREELSRSEHLYYKQQKQRWCLHAVQTYCGAIRELTAAFSALPLRSSGLQQLCAYLEHYAVSGAFEELRTGADALAERLRRASYSVLIKENGVSVGKPEDELDYAADVSETFAKFRQTSAGSYLVALRDSAEMNPVEGKIVEFVALLYPEEFAQLEDFCARHVDFLDAAIVRFDREVQFYVAYIDFMRKLSSNGLRFCYPVVTDDDKTVYGEQAFDAALALKLVAEEQSVVCNDFELKGEERIFVVSGPNQGGKTTFSRMFGQMHHLARIGCPVPGERARLLLCDAIFTHFEREESSENLRGKLEDDLVRLREILTQATGRSIVILNEIFSSTTLRDAVILAKKIIEQISALDLLCVCVTFLDELASMNEKTVSMVSSVDPENPAVRTYRVVRRPAEGRAYAISIAEKHQLTYERVTARMAARERA